MTIAIGSDHGGYELKLEVIKHLKDRGFEVTDYGCDSTASCDYPIYGKAVAEAIAAGKQDLGILICGTGIGMSMVANKVEGVRAALGSDANVLCMGARTIGPGLALMIVDKFVDTPFSNDERHVRRIKMFS